ncbi:MAG: hypothetical protein NW237_07910 [Cyanobacteriota bacterium]|nr:hypothetical protein [Cyanobacteriota bacterium]
MNEGALNQRFSQLAEAVTRVADVGSTGMQELEPNLNQLERNLNQFVTVASRRSNQQDERIRQLIDVPLATQTQTGNLSQWQSLRYFL